MPVRRPGTAPLADAATGKAGDPVVAIGNAGGTGGTPSAVGGAISALNQSIIAQDGSIRASEQLTGLIRSTPISGPATPAAHY